MHRVATAALLRNLEDAEADRVAACVAREAKQQAIAHSAGECGSTDLRRMSMELEEASLLACNFAPLWTLIDALQPPIRPCPMPPERDIRIQNLSFKLIPTCF